MMAAGEINQDAQIRGVGFYLWVGTLVTLLLFGGLGVWASTVQLTGAILASGNVVVDSSIKKVQHPTGGVVGSILVQDGQRVNAGDVVMRLDETVLQANLKLITKLLDEVAVRQARLKAERDHSSNIDFPADLRQRQDDAALAEIMESETALFASRKMARDGLKSQLRERYSQLQEELTGLESQLLSRSDELKYASDELVGLEELNRKSLVSTPRLTAARRTVSQLQGDIAQAKAGIAQAKGKITEIELQILQVDKELQTEVGKDLRDQQARQAELSERRVAAEDQLKRTEIQAPQSGVIHQLAVHTVGGVVVPGEPLMLVVPATDKLVIDAKVAPQDIDQVRTGQLAFVRFSAFNQRTTPEVTATVTRVSADLVMGSGLREPNEVPYYGVRLTLTDEAWELLKDLKPVPGMPVEIHITTDDRTALSYLAKPFADQFARAFRER